MALVAFPRNAVDDLPKNQLILLNLVKSCFPQQPEICFYSRYAVLIIDLSRNQRYMAQLQQIKQLAAQHGNIPLLIALSAESVSCKELHVLFEHTRHLIHLVEAEPDPDVVEVWQKRNFPDLHDLRHLDYTSINQLYPLLIKGEKDSAVSLLRELGQEFMHASLTDDVMNCQFFYNVRSVLTRVKAENPELLQDLQIQVYHSEMEQAAMIGLLEKCCCEVCARIYPVVSNRQAKFASSVLEYINANLSNSELSVRMVSNQFSVSEPTLQKVIRQEKGCTFYDYVEKQRYALVVQMLRDTDSPITRIASDCGYNSFNSFYKAFKRLADISPAAMRQQLRQEE